MCGRGFVGLLRFLGDQLAAVGTGAAQAVKLEDRFKELSKADWANDIGSGLPGAQYVDKIRPMAKSLPFVGNVATVASVLKEGYDYVANDGSGEDVAKAAGSVVASTAGAAFGGALGMPFGPLGAMAGAFIGSYVASEVATKAMQG